jgi:hypothetical protein
LRPTGYTDGIHCQGDTINAVADDTITIDGNGQGGTDVSDTVNMTGGTAELASNATGTVVGSNNTITADGDDNINVSGNSSTLTDSNAGDGVTVSGSSDSIGISSGTVSFGSTSTGSTAFGNNDTIDGAAGSTFGIQGATDTISASNATAFLNAPFRALAVPTISESHGAQRAVRGLPTRLNERLKTTK